MLTAYRVQDGCHNCRHAFLRWDYDGEWDLFCTLGAQERPPCMSSGMDECDTSTSAKVFSDACDKWREWSEGRKVEAAGICPEWKVKGDNGGK